MIKTVLLTFALIIVISSIATANMRAPYRNEFKGSTEIRTSIPNLTVMKEELLFACDFPYRGSLNEVLHQTREVQTSATYQVFSTTETDANFDFILTVNQPAKASINGIASTVSTPIEINKPKPRRNFGDTIDSSYRVSFSGHLKKGINTLNVNYSQPMSVHERTGGIYPFFITSYFTSAFSYDLSPLREWKLDDAFTMDIRITFKDDSGWSKHLFGSDYTFHLYGRSKQVTNDTGYQGRNGGYFTEIPFAKNPAAPNDSNEITIHFTKDFPEQLKATCEY